MPKFSKNAETNEKSNSTSLMEHNPMELQHHKTEAKTMRNQHKKTDTQWFPKDYKQALDAIQRMICIGLAAWAFVHGNIWESIAILSAGQTDYRRTKELLVKILKSTITEGK